MKQFNSTDLVELSMVRKLDRLFNNLIFHEINIITNDGSGYGISLLNKDNVLIFFGYNCNLSSKIIDFHVTEVVTEEIAIYIDKIESMLPEFVDKYVRDKYELNSKLSI